MKTNKMPLQTLMIVDLEASIQLSRLQVEMTKIKNLHLKKIMILKMIGERHKMTWQKKLKNDQSIICR